MWRLRPPRGDGDAPAVPVCIGSDDPITFATTLPAEYQLVEDALREAGLSATEATAWIEETRRQGMASRFSRSSAAGTKLWGLALPAPHAMRLPPQLRGGRANANPLWHGEAAGRGHYLATLANSPAMGQRNQNFE